MFFLLTPVFQSKHQTIFSKIGKESFDYSSIPIPLPVYLSSCPFREIWYRPTARQSASLSLTAPLILLLGFEQWRFQIQLLADDGSSFQQTTSAFNYFNNPLKIWNSLDLIRRIQGIYYWLFWKVLCFFPVKVVCLGPSSNSKQDKREKI